jgi:plasmid stability protein
MCYLAIRYWQFWGNKELSMQTLHVRSVPEELYDRLRALAQAKQRSLSAQVILLLDKALEEEAKHQEQAQVLAELRRRRFTPPPSAPDSVEMLREDRQR